MILTYAIETFIVGVVLAALWRISKKVDNGLNFLKKDAERISAVIYCRIRDLENEPSFEEKIKSEHERVNGIIRGISTVGIKVNAVKNEVNSLTERVFALENPVKKVARKNSVKK